MHLSIDDFLSYYVPILLSIVLSLFMSMLILILININIMDMKTHMLIYFFHICVGG
jgi:archaellum biogenesis protein FlaJ (TadC family)